MPESEFRLAPTMVSRRLLALAFVRDYIRRWGASPSTREIAAALNTNQTRAREAVKSLVRNGLVLRVPGPRGLSLPDDESEALRLLDTIGWTVVRPLPGQPGKIVSLSPLPAPSPLPYAADAQQKSGFNLYGKSKTRRTAKGGDQRG